MVFHSFQLHTGVSHLACGKFYTSENESSSFRQAHSTVHTGGVTFFITVVSFDLGRVLWRLTLGVPHLAWGRFYTCEHEWSNLCKTQSIVQPGCDFIHKKVFASAGIPSSFKLWMRIHFYRVWLPLFGERIFTVF